MKDFQRIGGGAALIEAVTFVVGLGLYFTLLAPYGTREVDPGKYVAFLADNQAIMYTWNLITYVIFGAALVVLALALYDRLKIGSPAMAQTATAFGLIWAGVIIASGMLMLSDLGVVINLYAKDPAQATSVWMVLDAVENGLASRFEIPGGLWILLLSWAAIRAGGFPKALSYFGLVVGVAGLLTLVPNLDLPVFGLGSIVWFLWVGIIMLRSITNSTDAS